MTVWPSALGRAHSCRPIKWWAILLLAALAFLIGIGVSYLLNRTTTKQRITDAAQVRWEASKVSCAQPKRMVAGSSASVLPQAIYSCVISGIPVGVAPSNTSKLTRCYGLGKTNTVLDVTNTVVYLRRHGQTLGLPCA